MSFLSLFNGVLTVVEEMSLAGEVVVGTRGWLLAKYVCLKNLNSRQAPAQFSTLDLTQTFESTFDHFSHSQPRFLVFFRLA